MESQPVKRSETPGYPTRREVLAGAAGFVLAGFTGVVPGLAGEAKAAAVQTVVAPIFDHGKGRGATGCIVVSPPVFLSEEEGMQVIREELAKHGIELKKGKTLKNIRVPRRGIDDRIVKNKEGKEEWQEKIIELKKGDKPLKLDGVDEKKKVAVEFASENDYFDLGGPMSGSSAQPYDFKEVFEKLREQIEKEGNEKLFVGLFYDPMVNYKIWGKHSEPEVKTRGKCKKQAKDLLRQQAKDFVAWLKKEKAI